MRCRWAFLALWLSLHGTPAAAETARQPLIAPRDAAERRLFDDAADGTLDQHALLPASLIASSVDPDRYLRRFESAKVRLRQQLSSVQSPRDRAATVLTNLHDEFLTGSFAPHCGSVAESIDSGHFNCVTAAILYAALADVAELPVTVLHAPGHVRVRVEGAAPFELEPTDADWFHHTDPRLVAWSQAPRELSPAALVAKLYYNQGVRALEAKQFDIATAALQRSLWLDAADQDARHNLLAALNNGAVEHCARRQFVAAARLLHTAGTIDPHYPPLAANDLHLLGQWTIALCDAGDFAAALANIDQAIARHPQSELARNGRPVVYRLWAEALHRQGEHHAALARAEAGLALAPENAALQQLRSRLKYPPRS